MSHESNSLCISLLVLRSTHLTHSCQPCFPLIRKLASFCLLDLPKGVSVSSFHAVYIFTFHVFFVSLLFHLLCLLSLIIRVANQGPPLSVHVFAAGALNCEELTCLRPVQLQQLISLLPQRDSARNAEEIFLFLSVIKRGRRARPAGSPKVCIGGSYWSVHLLTSRCTSLPVWSKVPQPSIFGLDPKKHFTRDTSILSVTKHVQVG